MAQVHISSPKLSFRRLLTWDLRKQRCQNCLFCHRGVSVENVSLLFLAKNKLFNKIMGKYYSHKKGLKCNDHLKGELRVPFIRTQRFFD